MGHDKYGRALFMGDTVRTTFYSRGSQTSLKTYKVEGIQSSIFEDDPLYLLSNGKLYRGYEILKEEKVTCS